jgi:hypothetical protein
MSSYWSPHVVTIRLYSFVWRRGELEPKTSLSQVNNRAIKRRLVCRGSLSSTLRGEGTPHGFNARQNMLVKHTAPDTAPSEISGTQLVRPFAASPINLRGGPVYQVAMRIEGAENSCLIGSQARLNSFQCVFIHVK